MYCYLCALVLPWRLRDLVLCKWVIAVGGWLFLSKMWPWLPIYTLPPVIFRLSSSQYLVIQLIFLPFCSFWWSCFLTRQLWIRFAWSWVLPGLHFSVAFGGWLVCLLVVLGHFRWMRYWVRVSSIAVTGAKRCEFAVSREKRVVGQWGARVEQLSESEIGGKRGSLTVPHQTYLYFRMRSRLKEAN